MASLPAVNNPLVNTQTGTQGHFDPTPGFNLSHWGPIPYPAATGTKNLLGFGGGGGGSAPAAPSQTGQAGATQQSTTDSGPYQQDQAAQQAAAQQAQANQYTDSQIGNINDLLGRTQTGLDQGLSQLNSSYQGNVNTQNNAHTQALQDYADNRTSTGKDKVNAYDTINRNANNGYRSLAQIIGRSAGTGSSAFQDLLPDVIGKDISGQRTDANQTYASNLGNIDTAQKKTDLSFQNILSDLANQRQAQEASLRTGVENQRQSLVGQQQQLEAQRGNYAGAQALQPQIEQSKNTVEGFFNQFKPTYATQQAAIAAPDLSQYQVDRSNVNAQQQGAADPTNPYADILRKKLQEGA